MSQKNKAQDQRSMLHEALRSQQAVIEAMGSNMQHMANKIALQDVIIDDIAGLAGVKGRVASIRRQADIDNPAEPVPNPPSEQAYEDTQTAVTPDARDDVRAPGLTPGSTNEVAADSVSTAVTPGEDVPTEPTNYLSNVQAPVQGTETHVPNEMTRIEEDVRISPNASPAANPEVAFPWSISENQSNDGSAPTSDGGGEMQGGQRQASKNGDSRTFAAMRLAQLQINAGIADGEDDHLVLGQKIASSGVSDQEIQTNITTLSRVAAAQSKPQQAPAKMQRSAVRSAPSLTGHSTTASLGGHSPVQQETADADLFG